MYEILNVAADMFSDINIVIHFPPGMTSLRVVKLQANRIVSIEDLSFLPALHVYASNNELVCDSGMAWMKSIPSTFTLTLSTRPCSAPADLTSTTWDQITRSTLIGQGQLKWLRYKNNYILYK